MTRLVLTDRHQMRVREDLIADGDQGRRGEAAGGPKPAESAPSETTTTGPEACCCKNFRWWPGQDLNLRPSGHEFDEPRSGLCRRVPSGLVPVGVSTFCVNNETGRIDAYPDGSAVGADGNDSHGAGAVRFDTLEEGGPAGEEPERIFNYVRLVRDA